MVIIGLRHGPPPMMKMSSREAAAIVMNWLDTLKPFAGICWQHFALCFQDTWWTPNGRLVILVRMTSCTRAAIETRRSKFEKHVTFQPLVPWDVREASRQALRALRARQAPPPPPPLPPPPPPPPPPLPIPIPLSAPVDFPWPILLSAPVDFDPTIVPDFICMKRTHK